MDDIRAAVAVHDRLEHGSPLMGARHVALLQHYWISARAGGLLDGSKPPDLSPIPPPVVTVSFPAVVA